MSENQPVEVSLRAMAAAALQRARDHEAAYQARREEERCRRAEQALSRVLGVSVPVTVLPVEIDGLRLDLWYADKEWLIRLLQRCPDCGGDASAAVYSLADLGRALEAPPLCGQCGG